MVDAPPPVYWPQRRFEHPHGHLPDIMAHCGNVSNRCTAGARVLWRFWVLVVVRSPRSGLPCRPASARDVRPWVQRRNDPRRRNVPYPALSTAASCRSWPSLSSFGPCWSSWPHLLGATRVHPNWVTLFRPDWATKTLARFLHRRHTCNPRTEERWRKYVRNEERYH